jgi:hypothetical protein
MFLIKYSASVKIKEKNTIRVSNRMVFFKKMFPSPSLSPFLPSLFETIAPYPLYIPLI